MNNQEVVKKLKLLTSVDDEQLLELYLDMAIADFLDYTNRKELPDNTTMLVMDIASTYVLIGKNRGIASYSEGAISLSYFNELSPQIKSRMNSYRLLPGVKSA